jgi:hypothetical protein
MRSSIGIKAKADFSQRMILSIIKHKLNPQFMALTEAMTFISAVFGHKVRH